MSVHTHIIQFCRTRTNIINVTQHVPIIPLHTRYRSYCETPRAVHIICGTVNVLELYVRQKDISTSIFTYLLLCVNESVSICGRACMDLSDGREGHCLRFTNLQEVRSDWFNSEILEYLEFFHSETKCKLCAWIIFYYIVGDTSK